MTSRREGLRDEGQVGKDARDVAGRVITMEERSCTTRVVENRWARGGKMMKECRVLVVVEKKQSEKGKAGERSCRQVTAALSSH